MECSMRFLPMIFSVLCMRPVKGEENILNLSSCLEPDLPADKTQWLQQNKNLCSDDKVVHCQQSKSIISMCATPIFCQKGTFAHLDTISGNVLCEKCTQDMFQPTRKMSYLFFKPGCDYIRSMCKPEYYELCANGSSSEDDKCRCSWEHGYGPDKPECKCFDSSVTSCNCVKNNCQGNETLDEDYKCVAVTTTTEATTATTTASSTADNSTSRINETRTVKIISKESDNVDGLAAGEIVGIVIGVIAVPVIGLFLGCAYRKRDLLKRTRLWRHFKGCCSKHEASLPLGHVGGNDLEDIVSSPVNPNLLPPITQGPATAPPLDDGNQDRRGDEGNQGDEGNHVGEDEDEPSEQHPFLPPEEYTGIIVGLKEINIVKMGIGKRWKDLGRVLGVSEADLEYAREDHRHDTRECVHEILKLWTRKNENPTVAKLADACAQVGKKNLAVQLTPRSKAH